MGYLIAIILLVVGVVWFIQTYPGIVAIVILLVFAFFIIRLIIQNEEEKKARRAREAAEQLEYERRIISACNESIAAFESIPKHLMTVEELLSTAENEFQEGAFSPFWDSIERVMSKLGDVDGSIKMIADRSRNYKNLIESYKGEPPPFPVDPDSAQRLGTVNDTAIHLHKIVRMAQRNFQFATIYEQRKTNEILIAGFTNLAEAIHGVGIRLQESITILGEEINDLSSSMSANNEKLVEAVHGVSQAVEKTSSKVGDLSKAIKNADTKTQSAAADHAARQETANRMLDNIQRHRVPGSFADH